MDPDLGGPKTCGYGSATLIFWPLNKLGPDFRICTVKFTDPDPGDQLNLNLPDPNPDPQHCILDIDNVFIEGWVAK
jgi:hypothetical protein